MRVLTETSLSKIVVVYVATMEEWHRRRPVSDVWPLLGAVEKRRFTVYAMPVLSPDVGK